MSRIKFDFIETPEKTLEAADVLMPNLSTLSESDLQGLKGGVVPCDAVCLPPGYDYVPPCNCKSNLA
ncbi:MAG: hypothetical protein QG657_1285 [Acidobacteriota bacterium]|nr:hypothetical protein [Acidobacteriota bacterium]